MKELLRTATQVAKVDCTVLLLGESGTGKEVLAKLIHKNSDRPGPLVKVNCGAIPETLLESELFGYEHGAFTGAKREGSAGKFEQAHKGLFEFLCHTIGRVMSGNLKMSLKGFM